ncbi:hypothetical protein KP509_30G042300 [Ceratopteris richardii]|uniref:Uncharacterized protein n=1 Tax=Ceratopteris richardii TaxID=49495 RepID=A0A8T2R200_CERRI|nr:hypothetical protein KP509_30G042300 [Ceratopteris richardii]
MELLQFTPPFLLFLTFISSSVHGALSVPAHLPPVHSARHLREEASFHHKKNEVHENVYVNSNDGDIYKLTQKVDRSMGYEEGDEFFSVAFYFKY